MTVVHVEVLQKPESIAHSDSLEEHILTFLKAHFSGNSCILLPFKFEHTWLATNADPVIARNVLRIFAESISGLDRTTNMADPSSVDWIIHIYQLQESESVEETLEQPSGNGGLFGDCSNDDQVTAALHWTLPCSEFDGLWESLYYDDPVKEKLLRYAQAALLFAMANVDPTIITTNRVVLLHGPPGTGKTSLCKALAQKLAIRSSRQFRCGQLIEINSHSLFSKYFSESGKLVLQMFKKIFEFVEDPNAFVCVLIDEVESLAAARKGAMQGNEPSDSLRVVNALLTQIDRLRRRPNVLLLATSNLTDAIDAAFVDRADLKLKISLPSVRATYRVIHSTIEELVRVHLLSGMVQGVEPLFTTQSWLQSADDCQGSVKLYKISKRAVDGGVSCRTLRKLALLAYSEIGELKCASSSPAAIPVDEFFPFLASALENALRDGEDFAPASEKGEKKIADSNSKSNVEGKENLMELEVQTLLVDHV